ncbi:major Facilitator Superfamily protein, partial [Vibrio parahaemolyticus V-223/04]
AMVWCKRRNGLRRCMLSTTCSLRLPWRLKRTSRRLLIRPIWHRPLALRLPSTTSQRW